MQTAKPGRGADPANEAAKRAADAALASVHADAAQARLTATVAVELVYLDGLLVEMKAFPPKRWKFGQK